MAPFYLSFVEMMFPSMGYFPAISAFFEVFSTWIFLLVAAEWKVDEYFTKEFHSICIICNGINCNNRLLLLVHILMLFHRLVFH